MAEVSDGKSGTARGSSTEPDRSSPRGSPAPAQLATAVVPPEDCTAVDQATCVASGAADPPEDCTAPRTPPCSESRMPLPHTPPPVDANRAYDADDESESSHGMGYNVGIDSE